MSGHSKWATIKHKKAITDAKRGQLFTKVTRELTVATMQGGADPASNFRLRLAIQKAKEANMPVDNIDRAIKRGAGAGDGGRGKIEEITYEGYGPGGAAILIQAVTDNRNRSISDIRTTLSRGGGNLGELGSVAWVFESRGVVTLDGLNHEEAEELALAAIEGGAEDFKLDGELLEVYSDPEHFERIRHDLELRRPNKVIGGIGMVSKNVVYLAEKEAEQTLRLLDRLEDLDDVQRVFTNADFPDEALERYRRAG